VDEFFESAPSTIKKYTQYIFDFLLAASGSEDEEDHDEMVSQLAIDMEEMELNPVRMQWASTHFSIVKKQASLIKLWQNHQLSQGNKTRWTRCTLLRAKLAPVTEWVHKTLPGMSGVLYKHPVTPNTLWGNKTQQRTRQTFHKVRP